MASDNTIKETAISSQDAEKLQDAGPQADMELMSVALVTDPAQGSLAYYHAPTDTLVNFNPVPAIGIIPSSPSSLFFAGNLITSIEDMPVEQVRELIAMCLSKFDLRFMPHMDAGEGKEVVPMAIRTKPASTDLVEDAFVHDFLVEIPCSPATVNAIIAEYEKQIAAVSGAGASPLSTSVSH